MTILPFLLLILAVLLPGCSKSMDSPVPSSRLRASVSGSIVEDAVWERGKEYYVTGDVTVEAGATLTIQPDVVVKFAHDHAADYYGLTVKGTLIADGEDSTTAILFTSGAAEWARKPGDWRGIKVEESSDSSSMIRYCHIQYANVGIKANRSSPRVSYDVVEYSADTGILFYGSEWGAVSGCTVRENKNGIRFELVEDGKIERCVVEDNEEHGIECKTSSPDIEDNLIRGNGWGIYCWYGASPGIRWNTLVDQKTGGIGQFGDCFSEIMGNLVIQHTGDGITIGQADYLTRYSVPRIKGNNLMSKSTGYAIKLNPVDARARHPDVDATENYWGSGDPVQIEANIYDGTDTRSTPLNIGYEYYHGRVVFEPFLVDSIRAAGVRLLRD